MSEYESPEPKEPVDYTGLKIVAMVAPVQLLVTFLYNADVAMAVSIVLGVMLFAIKIRWKLRKHIWFWAVIAVILALHVPLAFMVRLPDGHGPTLFYAMPIALADFLIVGGALGLAERLFAKGESFNEVDQ